MGQSFIAGDPFPVPFADTHPAWCAGYGVAGKWSALGASAIGPGHVRRYRPRDDAFVLMAANDYLVAAVADGVGGQIYSRIGAGHCANAVCREILGRMCVPHVRRRGVDDFDPATLPRELLSQGIPRNKPALHPPTRVAEPQTNWASSGTFRWNWRPYRLPFPTDLYEDDDPPPEPPTMRAAIESAFEATRGSLTELAATLRVKLLHCTCTLLVVGMDVCSGASVAAQLGDGAILHLDTLQPATPLSPRTEEDNPFTIGLENWEQGLVIAEPATRAGWLLLTDGTLEFFPEYGDSCRVSSPNRWIPLRGVCSCSTGCKG